MSHYKNEPIFVLLSSGLRSCHQDRLAEEGEVGRGRAGVGAADGQAQREESSTATGNNVVVTSFCKAPIFMLYLYMLRLSAAQAV